MRTLLGLRDTPDPASWTLPVTRSISNGGGFLWGGAGLAAAIEAMEGATGRNCLAATAQYLRPVYAATALELSVLVGQDGARVSQAQVHGRVDGETVLLTLGALRTYRPPRRGTALAEADLQWAEMPAGVPGPDEVDSVATPWPDQPPTMFDRLERRPVPPGAGPPGHSYEWARLRAPLPVSAAAVALLADLAVLGVERALGRPVGGASLDNTVRLARPSVAPDGGWLLLDVAVESVVGRVAQVSARIFDRAGVLVAVAGQSATIRGRKRG